MRLEIRVYAGLHKYIPSSRSGEPFQLEIPDCDGFDVYPMSRTVWVFGIPIK